MVAQKTALLAPPRGPEGADPRIAILADALARRDGVTLGAHRRLAREYFMDLHGDYYLQHVARYRKHVDTLVVAPHYIMIKIAQPVRAGRRGAETTSTRWFVIGVDYDTDMLWAVRTGAPLSPVDFHDVMKVNCVTVYITDDAWFRTRVFGYDFDITTSEYTIEVPGDAAVAYRVQGDLVFHVRKFDELVDLHSWARGEVDRYLQYIAADRIAAVLMDHGVSVEPVTVRGNYAIVIVGGTNSSRFSKFSRMNRERVIRILNAYFDVSAENYSGYAEARLRDGQMEIGVGIESWAYFGIRVGDVAVVVRSVHAPQLRGMLLDDFISQFRRLEKQDLARHYGNHALEFRRAIPVSLAYEPSIRPAVLRPPTLYVALEDTYIADRDTTVTVRHREHGERHIRFAGACVLRVDFLSTHRMDVAHRNRIALRRADALRPPRRPRSGPLF